MSDWQQGDVITNGIRMHYYRTGGDKPPVVLCHGGSDNGLCWTPVARVLAADYDVIMIDARNHGLSETPPPSNKGSQGDDLAGLIVALGLDRPAVMGHSMGGGATMMAAANHPELVGKAILEDSGPHDLTQSPMFTIEGRQRMADEMMKMAAKGREEIIAIGHAQSPTWSDEELSYWADSKLQDRPETFLLLDNPRTDWRETIARIQCPMLVIHADNDKGSGVTPEEAAEASRINPLVEHVYVPGAGHNVRRENFDDFMAAVTAFLAR
jgi:N-formylmaleamate deformylase